MIRVSHIPPNDLGACCGPVNKYTQCKLKKPFGDGNLIQVSWIPTIFASKNKALKLKSRDGTWDDGWVVEEVGVTKLGVDKEDGLMCECDHF